MGTRADREGVAGSTEWEHDEAIINGVRLHYVEAGEGPLVLLLHGFPEFWYAWRKQIPALADAGYHVVAPDMRGYNVSEKPHGIASYRMEELITDVLALIDHVGAERASIVGHDWGGMIAWEVAARHPKMVDRLAVLNAPHPAAYRRELRSLDQLERSWYVIVFQLPWLPERLVRSRGFRALETFLREDPVSPDAFDEEAIERYKRAVARPGALTAMIDYYRALFRGALKAPIRRLISDGTPPLAATTSDGRVERPTLVVWGLRDRALSPALTEGLDEWVSDVRVERLSDASHWVQADAPERVNESLVAFLDGSTTRR